MTGPLTRFFEPTESDTLTWQESWLRFKSDLPFQVPPFNSRSWGNPLHSLCSYAGKLKPSIAYHLVDTFVPEGGSVLDPFSGVGSVPFEAALNGKTAYGLDISEFAAVVSRAKLAITEARNTDDVISDLSRFIASYEPPRSAWKETADLGHNGKLSDYYHEKTLREILGARQYLRHQDLQDPSISLVCASLLHLLHGNRPYALSRRSHPITPYSPTGDFEHRLVIPRLISKVSRSLSVDVGYDFVPGQVFNMDATDAWPDNVNELDSVITSPPFFDSTRFHLQNWIRLWFMGWNETDFTDKAERFVDERQKESFEVYDSIIGQSKERLKSGGTLVFHLGKSKKCDMASEILKIGKRYFDHSDLFDESVAHLERHGMRDKGTTTNHQYLVLY